jgi:hypothetical protein
LNLSFFSFFFFLPRKIKKGEKKIFSNLAPVHTNPPPPFFLRRGRRKEAKIHQKQTNKRRGGRRKKKKEGDALHWFFFPPPPRPIFCGFVRALQRGRPDFFKKKSSPLVSFIFYLFFP